MTPTRKISVLLAVHNGAQFITDAIVSLFGQTHENWELVIVSNGSTDATVPICEALARSDPRIRVFEIADRNKNAAYNLAHAKSTGDYVCFFAADDMLPPESLAERIAILTGAAPEPFATCCLQTISADAKYDGLVFPKNVRKPNYSGGALLFSSELAHRIFPLPEAQPNEDTWASLHLRAFGENRHVPKVLYRYRIHGGNSYGYGMSFTDKRTQYLRRMHAYQLFYDKYNRANIPFISSEVRPFLDGLKAAIDGSVRRILLVRGLRFGSKLVLVLYSSPTIYRIRNTYFRAFSGGVGR